MPQVAITLPSKAWPDAAKKAIIEDVTEAIHSAAKDNGILEKFGMTDLRPNVNIQIHEAAESGYAVGGKVLG